MLMEENQASCLSRIDYLLVFVTMVAFAHLTAFSFYYTLEASNYIEILFIGLI
jgi:hypothetical protein